MNLKYLTHKYFKWGIYSIHLYGPNPLTFISDLNGSTFTEARLPIASQLNIPFSP